MCRGKTIILVYRGTNMYAWQIVLYYYSCCYVHQACCLHELVINYLL